MNTQLQNSVAIVHKIISAAASRSSASEAMQLTQAALNAANAIAAITRLPPDPTPQQG